MLLESMTSYPRDARTGRTPLSRVRHNQRTFCKQIAADYATDDVTLTRHEQVVRDAVDDAGSAVKFTRVRAVVSEADV